MEWQIIVALIIAIPIILFPVMFVWFINLSGIYAAVKEARARRAAEKKKFKETAKVEVEAN
jgi:Tfp pilus assembly protein PilO